MSDYHVRSDINLLILGGERRTLRRPMRITEQPISDHMRVW